MNNELLTILGYIEQERNISRDNLIKALESAILSASRRSIHPAKELKVKINPKTGDIQAWAMLEVVAENPTFDQLLIERAQERFPEAKLGEIVEWEVTPSNFGRIAAQTAKQAIIQQLRRAEKENVLDEFSDRVGQIINGVVRRFENGSMVVDFQKAEGILSVKDRVHGEQYNVGDWVNAYLVKVDINSAGPSLILSRSCPEFVLKLFEREVSEIRNGVVEIKGIAREAGSRTKISVKSNDPRIDPVGACVGIGGKRVRAITNELGGERIDIVPYDENIQKYTINALLPAKVQSVEVNDSKREVVVHVTEEQSKIAFGKKAQNVRLCSKLIGWNINIRTDVANAAKVALKHNLDEQIKAAAAKLVEELGISEGTALLLINNGYVTTDGVREAGRETILEIEGVNGTEINQAFDRLED